MVGVIPYYRVPVIDIGPIPIDPWATLVCVGFLVGMEVARARGLRQNLDVRDIVDGTVFTVGMGFLVGHLVHVLAYHPESLREEGVLALLKIWGGFSSMGGFIGALLGSVLFFKVIRKRPFWLHADTIMFGFPFGWVLGRSGCAVVHDHIGSRSDFLLAVDFPGIGSRHELGLYEALLTVVIAVGFWWLGRKARRPAFFTMLWCLSYAPMRFFLDFLRNTDLSNPDTRYGGFTPAQIGCVAMFAAGVALAAWVRRQPAPVPMRAD